MKESIQTHEEDMGYQSQAGLSEAKLPNSAAVTLLTGGGDKPCAFGLATELISKGVGLDVICSDELDCPEFHGKRGVNFMNLRGDQRPDVSFVRKAFRFSMYYARLIRYAVTAKPRIFQILWNNKFELFDRKRLMLYDNALRKKIVLTVHNVNSCKRDSKDSALIGSEYDGRRFETSRQNTIPGYVVGQATLRRYASLLRIPYPGNLANRDGSRATLNVKALS